MASGMKLSGSRLVQQLPKVIDASTRDGARVTVQWMNANIFLSAASSDFKATNSIQRENCAFPFTHPNFNFLKFSSFLKRNLNFQFVTRVFYVNNSLVPGPISMMNISFDSSRHSLSKIFWVLLDQIKRSAAKCRKTEWNDRWRWVPAVNFRPIKFGLGQSRVERSKSFRTV